MNLYCIEIKYQESEMYWYWSYFPKTCVYVCEIEIFNDLRQHTIYFMSTFDFFPTKNTKLDWIYKFDYPNPQPKSKLSQ